MANEFEVVYGNDDGFVGNGKHTFYIRERDLFGNETAEELADMFWQMIDDDFENNNKHLFSDQESEFVEWALAANKAAQEEE